METIDDTQFTVQYNPRKSPGWRVMYRPGLAHSSHMTSEQAIAKADELNQSGRTVIGLDSRQQPR